LVRQHPAHDPFPFVVEENLRSGHLSAVSPRFSGIATLSPLERIIGLAVPAALLESAQKIDRRP
jgi:hypothetical protein